MQGYKRGGARRELPHSLSAREQMGGQVPSLSLSLSLSLSISISPSLFPCSLASSVFLPSLLPLCLRTLVVFPFAIVLCLSLCYCSRCLFLYLSIPVTPPLKLSYCLSFRPAVESSSPASATSVSFSAKRTRRLPTQSPS